MRLPELVCLLMFTTVSLAPVSVSLFKGSYEEFFTFCYNYPRLDFKLQIVNSTWHPDGSLATFVQLSNMGEYPIKVVNVVDGRVLGLNRTVLGTVQLSSNAFMNPGDGTTVRLVSVFDQNMQRNVIKRVFGGMDYPVVVHGYLHVESARFRAYVEFAANTIIQGRRQFKVEHIEIEVNAEAHEITHVTFFMENPSEVPVVLINISGSLHCLDHGAVLGMFNQSQASTLTLPPHSRATVKAEFHSYPWVREHLIGWHSRGELARRMNIYLSGVFNFTILDVNMQHEVYWRGWVEW